MSLVINKVLASDPIDSIVIDVLKRKNIQVNVITGLKKDELLNIIKDYDALIVRSGTQVTADVINAGTSLKIIGRAGVGVDNIDVEAAKAKGIIVINAPGGNTISAAEMTCIMIVSLSRDVINATNSLKSGKWERKKFMGSEVYGKTLGIVGLGRIGREVAKRMQAFGMKTVGYDPYVSAEAAKSFDIEFLELEKIWPIADYITLHVPLIESTKNLINKEVLAKCKKGVKIINVARGGTIDEPALVESLNANHAGGAGIDVYMEEPPKYRELVEHPAVICTPHLGASTHEAQVRVAEEIALQILDLIDGKPVPGKV